jgi:hypothetical protein
VEAELTSVCNAINPDLGLPTTGTDSISACKGISARISAIIQKEPPAPPGSTSATDWVELHFPPSCALPPGTLESCLAKCAGPCDPSKCAPGKLSGTCPGTCAGTCTQTGDAVPCNGQCIGETGLDGGSCQGECTGVCSAQAWAGQCTGSCPAGFTGVCGGTCTGLCNGVPIGTTGMDSGAGDAESEAGDGGTEAAAAAPGTFKKPPGGDDGNCTGLCVGLCSSGANGDCKGPCLTFADAGPPIGQFTAGFCGAGGTPAQCTGACVVATGNGSISTCNGTCTQDNVPSCAGICRTVPDAGGCTVPLTNAFCEGNVSCGQNTECNNACQATAALAQVCTDPKLVQIYSVSDPVLFATLQKNGPALGKVVNELTQLRNAFAFIGNRAFGDFNALGLSGDLVRACVAEGNTNVATANTAINNAVSANPSTRKFQ